MQCSVCAQDNPPEAHFCSKCGNTLIAAVEPLHVSGIGVGSSYGNGWRQLWKHFLMLFVIGIIAALIGLPGTALSLIAQHTEGPGAVVAGILSLPFGIFLARPLGYGVSFAYLKAARNEQFGIRDMFAAFYDYWNVVLAGLLVTAIVAVGFVFCIVPGIIFACKLAFTPYLVVDRRMKVIDAVKESWRMTRGRAGTVFLIGLLAMPIFIAGLCFCGVGVIISVMWVKLAFASLYHAVSTSEIAAVHWAEPVA